jgi:hypothetical protein
MNRYLQRSIPLLLIFLGALSPAAAVDVMGDIVAPAQSLKGAPYVYGNAGPRTFDCSGLVYYLYRPLVPDIPRSSRDYRFYGEAVSREALQPGDLLLFATAGGADRISHVAIYIGQRSVIHAVSNGPQTGVIVSSIDSGYWRRTFHSARRVLPLPTAPATQTVTVDYERGRYTGPILSGEPNGRGRMILNNGDRYEGEFKEGLFHGEGVYTWADGREYRGEFRNGEMLDPPQTPGKSETYLEEQDSPWEDWDGKVYGDFAEWREAEESAFEAFKRRDQQGTADTLR